MAALLLLGFVAAGATACLNPPAQASSREPLGADLFPPIRPFPSTALAPRPLHSVARAIQVTPLAALPPPGLNREV